MSTHGDGWLARLHRVVDVVVAPAKLTVSLRITGVRHDGYHLIDSEMVSLDLADRLTISEGDGLEIVGRAAEGIAADDSNLVRRALAAVGRRAHVRVEKRIPAGAGLGGGSSDAAAILRWAGVDDVELAASLGADVPFCLVGGRARVTGVGEIVEPLPFIARTYTIVTPPFGVSTAEVYRAWDVRPVPAGGPNDLESAAIEVQPRLASWRVRISRVTGCVPVLAGSGSTWFVEGDHHQAADALAPATVVVAHTIS
jgi:4-diphosphocytidyl-2-C-methyl-D-erythritol kinase